MPSEINIEEQIREAMERGDFDNLEGKGKPLDLSAYFSTPEDIRVGFAMLKSNDYVPEEVEMLRELAELKRKAEASEDDAERKQLMDQFNAKRLSLDLLLESRRRKR